MGPRKFCARFPLRSGSHRYGFLQGRMSWGSLTEGSEEPPESRHVWPCGGLEVIIYCLAAPFRWDIHVATWWMST